MRPINLIVIHCSATKEGADYSTDWIRSEHIRRGFRDVGYHYVIRLDGTIEMGRPIEEAGAHVKGYNDHSIGVCYIGGLDSKGKPVDTRTVMQHHALRACVDMLKIRFGDVPVKGHRDLSPDVNHDGQVTHDEWLKSCPCFSVTTEL